MKKQEVVKFHETEIIAFIDDNGTPLIAIKSICDAIGLNAVSAARGIKEHPILGDWHTVEYVSVDEIKKINHVLLPIEYVSGWLFSINANKVKPEIREKLLTYQRECYRVLYEYFFGKQKVLEVNVTRKYEISERLLIIDTEKKKLEREEKELRKEIGMLQHSEFMMYSLFKEDDFNRIGG